MYTTKIDIPASSFKIGYENNILTFGSCFSENIGMKLSESYFSVETNPFGVLYNPLSIYNSINYLIDNKHFTSEDLFFDGSLWHSFSHSSLFSDITPDGCLNKINSRLECAVSFLRKTNVLLITLGTAWVYEYIADGRVVSNCHKLPAKNFLRYRLTTDDIVERYTELIWKLKSILPELQIIFTVSPIRHWKDGAHENNISKGILLQAVDSLQKQFDHVAYFPAYEIQLDELRDYRYYADDMLHPSDMAVNYIWKRFSETYFADDTLQLKKELEQLKSDLSHRPFQPHSDSHNAFLKKVEEKKQTMIQRFPFLEDRLNGK